ncbi:MAG: glucosaminidase domain-containing protein, partial [Candidatus Krumholzibacteria bacterium]|nr:glucosaminidase domain-containing protein [Candidatus Krumholzibacteria bacterium]
MNRLHSLSHRSPRSFSVFLITMAVLSLTLLISGGCAEKIGESKLPHRTVVTQSTEDVFEIFDSLGYTAENWAEGVREIPRIYMTRIPSRWKTESDKITVVRKKQIFFRLLAPVILRANELIVLEREELETLTAMNPDPGSRDMKALLDLGRKYKVTGENDQHLTTEQLAELKIRIDIIPPSLALAQGAEESGWGTSRFALLGNSLFGQWDFSGKGIKPEQQRSELGDYGLAAFDTPLDAVIAYTRNLNTHRAYMRMRQRRAEIRQKGREPSGFELVDTLDKYSERGQGYVDGLHALMRVNKLAATD